MVIRGWWPLVFCSCLLSGKALLWPATCLQPVLLLPLLGQVLTCLSSIPPILRTLLCVSLCSVHMVRMAIRQGELVSHKNAPSKCEDKQRGPGPAENGKWEGKEQQRAQV